MKPTLVVLAAGMGSRFGGVKQIEPVGPQGEIILEYSVFDAIRAGFGKVVFVLRADIVEDFRAHVLPRFQDKIKVELVLQSLDKLLPGYTVPEGRTKPWGTGHAVLMAAPVVHEPFAVINADDFYGAHAYEVMGAHLAKTDGKTGDFSMVGYELRNTVSDFGTVSRGLCTVDAAGKLRDVEEHTKIAKTVTGIVSHREDGSALALTGAEVVSMNLFGFTPRIFRGIEEQFRTFLDTRRSDLKAELYIPTVVNTMVHKGEATTTVLHSSAAWFGVTYREDLESTRQAVAALHAAGAYPSPLWG